MRIRLVFILVFCFSSLLNAQEADSLVLGFREYLAYVKQFHPVARQAQIVLGAAEANLLQSRGGFDPKLEVDYDRKHFLIKPWVKRYPRAANGRVFWKDVVIEEH